MNGIGAEVPTALISQPQIEPCAPAASTVPRETAIESYTVAVLAILFVAALTRSTFGIGDALVAMPLLSLVPGIETAGFSKPLVALVIAATSGWIMLRSRQAVDWKSAGLLVLSAAVGIPLGLYYVTRADEQIIKGALGLLVILFALYGLAAPRLPEFATDRAAWLFGFCAGLLGGAYNAHGPPLAIYGAIRRWPAERFRATLQAYFFPASLLIVCGDALNGLWTQVMLLHFAGALPLLIAAAMLGQSLNARFDLGRFRFCLYLLLLCAGSALLVSAVG